jgi:hypothetical protein
MSARVGAIVDLEGEPMPPTGRERRRAVIVAFALCLAIGAATVGRDKPAMLAAFEPARTLSLPAGLTDVELVTFPDRLANEPPPPFPYVSVRVRGTEGLAVVTRGLGLVPTLYWTEGGIAYWLTSSGRDVDELITIAESLR